MLYRLFILLFVSSTYTSFAQKVTFPEYQEIVETLINNTRACQVDFNSSTKLNIEKRVDGYWVGISTYDLASSSTTISQRQLFWSLAEQKYNSVEFKIEEARLNTLSQSQILTRFQRIPEYDPYNMNPFFGYKGWYHDVIKWYSDLEAKRPLEDFELYSLARAYSKYAKITLSAPYEVFYGLPDDFLTDNKASSKRIELYNSIENKATYYFHQTYLKNPNWKTITGNIIIKYSNEVVTQYHTLALHTTHEEALKVFEGKELYTKKFLAFIINTLESCPPNAILWTYGDNTSLPMFYLQQIKGIRKDVLVTNAYQLSLSRYIDYVTNPKIHTNPIVLDLDSTIYAKGNNDYLPISTGTAQLEIEDLKLALSSGEKDRFFRSNKISLPFQGNDKLKLDLNTSYLMKNEWVSLFIFAQNQRPLCFTADFKLNGYSFVKNLNIRKHIYPVGLIYQLDKEEHTIASDEEIETSYDIITNQLKWIPIKTISEEEKPAFYSQLWSILVLARDLYNKDKSPQVVYLLDQCRENFPIETIDDYYFAFSFVDLYFKANTPKTAEKLIELYFQKLLLKDRLNSSAFRFVKQIDLTLQERKIDKFNKSIQELYLKPNDSPSWE